MAQAIIPLAAGAAGFNVAAGTIGGAIAAGIGLVIDSYLFAAIEGDPDPIHGSRITSIQGFRGQEGLPLVRLWGKQRVGSQALWREAQFTEDPMSNRMSLGKGRTQETITYSYSISFAVAFCEGGPGTKLLGLEMNTCPVDLEWETRNGGSVKGGGDFEFFPGIETQPVSSIIYERSLRDWMEAGNSESSFPGVPAYRGVCYIAFRNLKLDMYHNRIPAIRATILRPSLGRTFLLGLDSAPRQGEENGVSELPDWRTRTQLLTLGPGYGESVYEPSALRGDDTRGNGLNFNARLSATEGDVIPALDQMDSAFPNAQGLNVPVTWFRTPEGDVKPGVETKNRLLITQPWSVSGLERDDDNAIQVSGVGGTPSDSSIFNFIKYLLASGSDVELTCRVLNPDGTSAKEEVVRFGSARVEDFEVNAEESTLVYNGDPDDFGYRRMVLHYASLLRLARLTANPQERRVALLAQNGSREFQMREPRVSCLWIGDSMRGTTRERVDFRGRRPGIGRGINLSMGARAFSEIPPNTSSASANARVEARLNDAFEETIHGAPPNSGISMRVLSTGNDYIAWLIGGRNNPDDSWHLVEQDETGNIHSIRPFTDFRPLWSSGNPSFFEAHYIYDPGWQSRPTPSSGTAGSATRIPRLQGRFFRWHTIDDDAQEELLNRSFEGAEEMGILLREAIEASGLARSTVGYIAAGDEYHSAQFPETGPIENRFVYFNMNWIWRETSRIGIRADLPYSNFRDETNYSASALQFRSGEYWEYIYASEADRATDTRTSILPAVDNSRVSHLDSVRLPINYNPFMGWKNIGYWLRHNHNIEDWGQPDGSRPFRLLRGLRDGLRNHGLDVFLSCRAVDKATNGPRDDLPPFSNGNRDDLVQNPYFGAAFAHFSQLTRRIYVEGWDARPEEIIRRSDLWEDAERWAASESLVRRTSPSALSATLFEILRASGLEGSQLSVNLAESPASFIGYSAQGGQSGRGVIAPLLQAYAQNAYESGGRIVVKPKDASDVIVVEPGDLVPTEELPEGFQVTHAADSSIQSSVRVSYYEADGNEIASVPAYLPHRRPGREASTSFSLVMGEAHARAVGQVSLREGEIAAERWRLNLPPEYSAIEPSDIIELNDLERSRILVTGVERGDFIQIEGHKAEPGIYDFRRIG